MDKTEVFIMGIAVGAFTIWLLWICTLLTPRGRKCLRDVSNTEIDVLIPPANLKLDADQIAKIKAGFQGRYVGIRNADREERDGTVK